MAPGRAEREHPHDETGERADDGGRERGGAERDSECCAHRWHVAPVEANERAPRVRVRRRVVVVREDQTRSRDRQRDAQQRAEEREE